MSNYPTLNNCKYLPNLSHNNIFMSKLYKCKMCDKKLCIISCTKCKNLKTDVFSKCYGCGEDRCNFCALQNDFSCNGCRRIAISKLKN